MNQWDKMEGKSVVFNNVEVKIKLYGLFDLAALNKIVGKQSADIAVDHCVIVLLGQIFGPGIDYTWQNFIPKLNIIIKKTCKLCFCEFTFFFILILEDVK